MTLQQRSGVFKVWSWESNFIPRGVGGVIHLFWSAFLIYSFWCTLASFPPQFNKDKTESRIVAAKLPGCRNMKSFMSSVEWKLQLFSLCSLWDNLARLNAFSLLLCCCVPCWTCSDCTCAHILIISVAIEWVFVFCPCAAACQKGGVRCVRFWSHQVCVPSAPSDRRMCGQELFRPPAFVWKRNKDTSLHTPTPSVFNSHANEVGGNTNHESQSRSCYGYGNANREIRVHMHVGVCAGCHAYPWDRQAKTARFSQILKYR